MIAYLKGQIFQKTSNYIILTQENGSIGYKIFTTPDILNFPLQSSVELYIFHKSGDDGQTLFGMPDFESLKFFELLLSVTGVGPKVALTIISSAKIDLLQQSIVNADAEIFTRMSGVGKKTAERIILELKNKITGAGIIEFASATSSEVYDALQGLGYNPREIREVIPKLDVTTDTATQLKQALKILSRN